MIGRLFRALAGRDRSAEPPPRLTEDEAQRIAERAVAGLPLADRLVANGRTVDDGRLVWHFWTATIGSGLFVRVDDATGEAAVERSGGR